MASYMNDPDVAALIQKKKNDAKKAIEDEKNVNTIIKDRFWSDVLQMYNGYRQTWTPQQCSVTIMAESYNTINQFQNSITNDVKSAVKEYIDEWWGKHMDIVLNDYTIDCTTSFGNYWARQGDPLDTIVYKLKNDSEKELWYTSKEPCFSSPPPPPTNWKAYIVRYIANPLIQEEYGKLINYWIKYKERSKRESQQPSPEEAKKKIKELEEKVKLLSERNSVLEEKFAILKTLININ